MKKLVIASLAAVVLASFSSALAQDSASHQLRVTIPSVVGIRILPAPAAESAATPSVIFDYASTTNQAAYLTAITAAGVTYLPPTSTSMGEIQVVAIGSGWSVAVTTAGSFDNTEIDLDRVRVSPIGHAVFDLGSVAILEGGATAWTNLGINGGSYELGVDGSEVNGDDTITVIYTISAI